MKSLLFVALTLCAYVLSQDGPVNYLYIPTYGNQSSDGSFYARVYGVAYRRDDSDGGIRSGSWFVSDDSRGRLEREATTDQERINLNNRLDPFLHWDDVEDTSITFSYPQLNQNIAMKGQTDNAGMFDEFLNLPANSGVQVRNTYQYTASNPPDQNGQFGNVTFYTPDGWSVISDIDDVIRITEIYRPFEALKNVFLRDITPVPGMPQLYNSWATKLPNAAFHYATETPILLAPQYIQWIPTVYPRGTLDLRPIDLTDLSAVFGARLDQVQRIGATYPNRKFIFVGDTSSSTTIRAYPEYARAHPEQLGCIFIRNTTYSYPDFSNPLIDLEREFRDIPRSKWFVFNTPDELLNADILGGSCKPPGIPANQTTSSGGYEGTGTRSSSSITTISMFGLMILSVLVVLMN